MYDKPEERKINEVWRKARSNANVDCGDDRMDRVQLAIALSQHTCPPISIWPERDLGYFNATPNRRPSAAFLPKTPPHVSAIQAQFRNASPPYSQHQNPLLRHAIIHPTLPTHAAHSPPPASPHPRASTMAFIPPTPLSLRPAPRRSRPPARHPRHARASLDSVSPAPRSTLPTPIYGSDEDVCTFGAECILSPECVSDSPALQKLAGKYLFPMRENHTQVFFDNSVDDRHTLAIVFAEDRHGFVLDVVSVLKALSVRVHRSASSENDALRLLMSRIEGELVSLNELNLSLQNCVAFWISDEETGEKIFDDGERLAQIAECLKIELNGPHPRPKPAFDHMWHRISIQKNRADRYTVFAVQTLDRPGLLAAMSKAFADVQIDVASATVKTFAERVENHFFVTKQGFKEPLKAEDIEMALESVMKGLLTVGEPAPNETLWYQTRDGTDMMIAEAIFIDEVNNQELACFKFSQFETPNFRGRLPEAPYRPVSMQ